MNMVTNKKTEKIELDLVRSGSGSNCNGGYGGGPDRFNKEDEPELLMCDGEDGGVRWRRRTRSGFKSQRERRRDGRDGASAAAMVVEDDDAGEGIGVGGCGGRWAVT
ncbi:hypothetical protein U1Q18_020538 [Sarracenia purpurea var. burkii]